jgi:hypothetical protein
MPLHAQHVTARHLDCFHNTIGRATRHAQRRRYVAQHLMMQAVHTSLGAIEIVRQRTTRKPHRVARNIAGFIEARVAVAVIKFDMLGERATELHVDELRAATDSEQRNTDAYRLSDDRKFPRVAIGLGMAKARFGLRVVEARVNVGAAGNHHAIEALQQLGHGRVTRQLDRKATGPRNGTRVLGEVQIKLGVGKCRRQMLGQASGWPTPTGNANQRFVHCDLRRSFWPKLPRNREPARSHGDGQGAVQRSATDCGTK